MSLEPGKAYYIGEFRSFCLTAGFCAFRWSDQSARDAVVAQRKASRSSECCMIGWKRSAISDNVSDVAGCDLLLLANWRKAAGVEPARERMPSPTGFEARPRHRARLPSLNSLCVGVGQRVVGADLAGFAEASGQADAVEIFEVLNTAFASQA